MLFDETARAKWARIVLSIARIFIALFYMQHGLSKYIGFPAPPPANFHTFSLFGLAGVIEIIGSALLLIGYSPARRHSSCLEKWQSHTLSIGRRAASSRCSTEANWRQLTASSS
jgi:hypothetical protein